MFIAACSGLGFVFLCLREVYPLFRAIHCHVLIGTLTGREGVEGGDAGGLTEMVGTVRADVLVGGVFRRRNFLRWREVGMFELFPRKYSRVVFCAPTVSRVGWSGIVASGGFFVKPLTPRVSRRSDLLPNAMNTFPPMTWWA